MLRALCDASAHMGRRLRNSPGCGTLPPHAAHDLGLDIIECQCAAVCDPGMPPCPVCPGCLSPKAHISAESPGLDMHCRQHAFAGPCMYCIMSRFPVCAPMPCPGTCTAAACSVQLVLSTRHLAMLQLLQSD